MFAAFLHNTAIPLRIRKKIGKLIPVRAGMDFSTPLFGQKYAGITGSHLDNKTFIYGMHEPASIRFMRATLKAQRAAGMAPVYFDVGTNTGAHLIAIAPLASKAFGFEPWGPVRSRAQDNITRNGLSHVTLCAFGLSDQDAMLPFVPPGENNHGNGSFYLHDDAHAQMLEVRKGDGFVSGQDVAPTLIKIDTEGHEPAVLKGLFQTLRGMRPVVVFEYSSMTKEQVNAQDDLVALFGEGYSFYGIKQSREYPKVVPFRIGGRFENLIAWPKNGPALEEALRLTREE